LHSGMSEVTAQLCQRVHAASEKMFCTTHPLTLDSDNGRRLASLSQQFEKSGSSIRQCIHGQEDSVCARAQGDAAGTGPSRRGDLKQDQLASAEAVCRRTLAAKVATFGLDGRAWAPDTLTKLGNVFREQEN
jgi:hypothetical protein